MSSTGIGKILKDAGGQADKKTGKETKQKTDEIVKELVGEAPKRGPGRPPKANSPGRPPKTPPRSTMPSDAGQDANTSPVDKIRNQIIIKRMRLYVRKFPEYSQFFDGYNPLLFHPDDNQKLIDAFLELIHDEIEFATAPAAVTSVFSGAEDAAVAWAIKNPEHPMASVVEEFSGVSQAILTDKAVSLDIRLLECEISGFLPKNPKLRLLLNTTRAIFQYWSKNRMNTVVPPSKDGPAPQKEEFKNL